MTEQYSYYAVNSLLVYGCFAFILYITAFHIIKRISVSIRNL